MKPGKTGTCPCFTMIIFLTACIAHNGFTQMQDRLPALKEVYKKTFLIGTAVNDLIVSGKEKPLQDLVIQEFNAITPENVMKAALVNPQPGIYNFGPAEAH